MKLEGKIEKMCDLCDKLPKGKERKAFNVTLLLDSDDNLEVIDSNKCDPLDYVDCEIVFMKEIEIKLNWVKNAEK